MAKPTHMHAEQLGSSGSARGCAADGGNSGCADCFKKREVQMRNICQAFAVGVCTNLDCWVVAVVSRSRGRTRQAECASQSRPRPAGHASLLLSDYIFAVHILLDIKCPDTLPAQMAHSLLIVLSSTRQLSCSARRECGMFNEATHLQSKRRGLRERMCAFGSPPVPCEQGNRTVEGLSKGFLLLERSSAKGLGARSGHAPTWVARNSSRVLA